MTRHPDLTVPLRLIWLVAVLGALWFLGVGLEENFYIEPTSEALERAAHGTRLVQVATLALVGATALGWWCGAPRWSWLVLLLPTLCGALLVVWPEQLLGWLGFFVAGPLAALTSLVAVFRHWGPPVEDGADLSGASATAPRRAR